MRTDFVGFTRCPFSLFCNPTSLKWKLFMCTEILMLCFLHVCVAAERLNSECSTLFEPVSYGFVWLHFLPLTSSCT